MMLLEPRDDITTKELAHIVASASWANPVKYLARECPTALRHYPGMEGAIEAQTLYETQLRATIDELVKRFPTDET